MTIALYGATGYQAGLVLAELLRRGVEPVLIGRDADRLQAAARAAGLPGAVRRVAAADDRHALAAALRGCAVVVNTAGPFTPTGAGVVRAAIDAGCAYVDTAGEQLYHLGVFDILDAPARDGGVTVVPGTTDGCLPIDLVAHLIGDRVGPLAELSTAHLITGGGPASRGSIRSLLGVADLVAAGGLTFDAGSWRTGVTPRHTSIVLPDGSTVRLAPFPVPEVVTVPRHLTVDHVEGAVDAALADRFATPPDPRLVDALPPGPTADQRRAQEFTYVVDAAGRDGDRVRAVLRGTDTYGTTAVIAAEAALRLADGGPPPGVLAPAQAFDAAAFLTALARTGLTWSLGPGALGTGALGTGALGDVSAPRPGRADGVRRS